uniref:Uncharacterized protein n=1 Tax=Panagrolaimus superbus TaxID=310955 RepID=A0A914YTR8_9BILA
MEETVINDSEMSSENDAGDMPVLDAMEVTEPTIKKIRLESYPQNFEIISSSECQTDLQLNHILQLEEVKKKFKNLKDKIHYHKKKSQALKERNNDYENLVAELEEDSNLLDEEVHQLQIFREENEKLKQEVQERDKIILELNDLLGNHKKNNKFLLKNKNSKFTVEAHTCFSRLLSQGNVAQDKVSIVIRVVADLFKISIDAVPSRWTVGRDIHTIQSLNCEYIDKFINECSNLSFLSDETTKFTKKLQAFVLTGKNDRTHQKKMLTRI